MSMQCNAMITNNFLQVLKLGPMLTMVKGLVQYCMTVLDVQAMSMCYRSALDQSTTTVVTARMLV